MRKLITQHGGDAEEARRLWLGGDGQGAATLLHNLSGVAGFLQAPEVARLASDTEQALQDGKTEALAHLLAELQAALQTLRTSIDQFDAVWVTK